MFEPIKVYPNGNDPEVRNAFLNGLEEAKNFCRIFPSGMWRPHFVAGKEVYAIDGGRYETVDPNDPTFVVGRFPLHDLKNRRERRQLNRLLKLVAKAQERWRDVPLEDRARVLKKLVEILMERMWLFLGMMTLEGGKRPFVNGIGEFMEIIDFINNAIAMAEKYLNEASPSAPPFMCDFNGWRFEPKGVFVDIEPFNFALAIPANYIALLLITGNAVVMKTSGHTPMQGYLLYTAIQDAFDACGIENNGVVNFLSGHGAGMAMFLLRNRNVVGYSFTGSYDAYWNIQRTVVAKPRKNGAKTQELAAETSGCNAMVIDESLTEEDLPALIEDIIQGFINNSAQTCSHQAHAIIHRKWYKRVSTMLIERLEKLRYGDTKNLNNECGAIISRQAVGNCEAAVKHLTDLKKRRGSKESYSLATLLYQKKIPERDAYDFAPRLLSANARAYENRKDMRELRSTEIFGMAMTLWVYDEWDQAREIFENCLFGLTGGLWGNDLDHALDVMCNWDGAGQMYFRNKITSATVGMAFCGRSNSGSSGSGVGASTPPQLWLCSDHVNVSVRIPKGADRDVWIKAFAAKMPIALS